MQAEAFETFISAPTKVVYLSLEQAGILYYKTAFLTRCELRLEHILEIEARVTKPPSKGGPSVHYCGFSSSP
jgi:hypothetical protein